MTTKVWPAIFAVITVWCAGITAIVVGKWLHLGVGLNVWFSGQDLDWYLLLKQGSGLLAAYQEFHIDARNPLSGWLYTLFAPIILSGPSGFHIVHLLSCLILALSMTLLSWQLGRRRTIVLPACLGSVIALFWFWSYVQQIMSLMLLAYGMTALSIYCFCVYVDSGRSKPAHYAWSIVIWLCVLGVYSIQSGAIIAFVLLSLARQRRVSGSIIAAVA